MRCDCRVRGGKASSYKQFPKPFSFALSGRQSVESWSLEMRISYLNQPPKKHQQNMNHTSSRVENNTENIG